MKVESLRSLFAYKLAHLWRGSVGRRNVKDMETKCGVNKFHLLSIYSKFEFVSFHRHHPIVVSLSYIDLHVSKGKSTR